MAIKGVDTKCYILALFVRDDGERFLLGSGHYEFKDTQMHFAANAIQNDIVEVQGNDGFLLAGQVRRPGTQSFDGYVGDGTMSKEETESYRRQFFSFFRKNFFYKVIYVFSDGTAIQRKSGFLVDDPTVEELYQMYPEYHVALNFEDVNYYSYSEDEEGQEQYAKEATIDTSSMRATGGLVWDNLGVVWEDTQWGGEQTASGTEMTIQNDMDVPSIVDDIRLDGDTYQQTYSGKNLLEGTPWRTVVTSSGYPSYIGTGITINSSDNNNIDFTSTENYRGVESNYIQIANGTTITVSFTGTLPNRLYVTQYDSNKTRVSTLNPSVTTVGIITVTTTQDGYVTVAFANSTSGSFTISNVKMEVGSSVTPYEPYTGGIPAPNPDYPQTVQTVTGEQTVKVTGKNIATIGSYDISGTNYNLEANYGNIKLTSTNANNAFDLNAGIRVGAWLPNYGQANDYHLTELGGIYAVSVQNFINRSSGSGNTVLQIFTNKRSINRSIAANATYVTPFSIVLADDEYIKSIYLWTPSSSSVNMEMDIQLEEGSTATAYESYQGQSYTISLGSTELCKIGTYQDYIYKSGDDWYVHKEVGKQIVDVSAIALRSNYSNIEYGTFDKPNDYGGYGAFGYAYPIVCTHAIHSSNPGSWNSASNIGHLYSGAETAKLWIGFAKGTGLDAIKTKLTGCINYYALGAPTDTQITDDTLIGQLDALGAMRLFIGENNLIVQATGTNLPAPLSFKYYTTVAMTGAEWEEGGSGGATVVEVDSITNTYPVWRVKGPAVDPQLSVINTNTTIRYTGTVTSTQTLEIDMFNKTAKLNGVSVIGNVSGDWVSLAPGTNRVIYTAENADAQPSTIEWQEVVG